MKKIALILSLCLSICLCGCSFVSFVPEGQTDSVNVDIRLRDELISKLGSLVDLSDYRYEEQTLILRYITEGKSRIYESRSDEESRDIFAMYESLILALQTDEQLTFQEHQDAAVQEVESFVNPIDYRDEEASIIRESQTATIAIIQNATTIGEIDDCVREYKTIVGVLKTDSEYYAEELEAQKQACFEYIDATTPMALYREEQRNVIQSFFDMIDAALTKEEVQSLLDQYEMIRGSLLTDDELYENELSNLLQSRSNTLRRLSEVKDVSEETHKLIVAKINDTISNLESSITKEGLNANYVTCLLDVMNLVFQDTPTYRFPNITELLSDAILCCCDTTDLDQDQETAIAEVAIEARNEFETLSTDDHRSLFENARTFVLEIKERVAAYLSIDEAELFAERAKELFGENYLPIPTKIAEADSYDELADIIDYYAFHQLPDYSLVKDSFRVRINFEYENAAEVKNTVYWHCQLLRGSMGLDCTKKRGSNVLSFHLIPYEFAKETGKGQAFEHFSSKVGMAQTSSAKQRDSSFGEFAYLRNEGSARVINSQQLLYALQNRFIPICDPNSPAQALLEKAKSILRQIITDDMSFEEKVFHIYEWFAYNVRYDYGIDYATPDPKSYPDEWPSRWRALFAEGALFDGIAVCHGYAKAMSLLLCIEGIEAMSMVAMRTDFFEEGSIDHTKNGTTQYGSHGVVAIKAPDNLWYYCDPQNSSMPGRAFLPSFIHLMLPFSHLENHQLLRAFKGDLANDPYLPLYERIVCGEQSYLCTDMASVRVELETNQCMSFMMPAFEATRDLEIIQKMGYDFAQVVKSYDHIEWVEFTFFISEESRYLDTSSKN